MKAGKPYYLTLTAMDSVGLESHDTAQVVPQFNDSTPPSSGCGLFCYPILAPQTHLVASDLFQRTEATDVQSGIYKYQFRITNNNPPGVAIDWTDMPDQTYVLSQGVLPKTGVKRWFEVRAVNGVGLSTATKTDFVW